MAFIEICSKKYQTHNCLVDNEDYSWLTSECSLWLSKARKTLYVMCSFVENGVRKRMLLHRLIYSRYNPLSANETLDHADCDPLNNQKSNLRIATYSQNAINKIKKNVLTSRYKGVNFSKGKWISKIQKEGKSINIGHFPTELDAAIAYDIVAKLIFGNFAKLNIQNPPKEDYQRVFETVNNPRRKSKKDCTSQYLGVYFHSQNNYWVFKIRFRGTKSAISKFGFATDLEAAVARDRYIDENNLSKFCFKSLVSRLSTF